MRTRSILEIWIRVGNGERVTTRKLIFCTILLKHSSLDFTVDIEGQDLATDCKPHIYLSAKRGERLLYQFRGDVWSTRRVPKSWLASRPSNHCKSVVPQIHHNAGLAPVHPLGIEPETNTCEAVIKAIT